MTGPVVVASVSGGAGSYFVKKLGYSTFLYDAGGFSHSNCAGFCVKMGHRQARRLLQVRPDVYAYHEAEEERTRQHIGADVAVLKYRSGPRDGEPLTLAVFREAVEANADRRPTLFDAEDRGEACSCMEPAEPDEDRPLSRAPRIEEWCSTCDGWTCRCEAAA